MLLGSDIASMSEEELCRQVENVSVFAKLSPQQKTQVITALRANTAIALVTWATA